MGCGRGNDVTYPNKASFGASCVSKLALFEYVTSFPLPHPIKILKMLHQVVTRSFFMGSWSCILILFIFLQSKPQQSLTNSPTKAPSALGGGGMVGLDIDKLLQAHTCTCM